MATYVVGDIQGCYDEFEALLKQIEFSPPRDQMVLAGDLVNRGPKSLQTLRTAKAMTEHVVSILGNHDLHLLAAAAGSRPPKRRDTLDQILTAPDREELIAWLSQRPVAHWVEDLDVLVVHAGVPPQWSVSEALERAAELEAMLRSPARDEFLAQMYGDQPSRWEESLRGMDRLRYITNAFTRIRYIDAAGRLDVEHAGPPGTQPAGHTPWYAVPQRATAGRTIAFGHWATLQNIEPLDASHQVIHLDTGCVWGGALTAVRLDDRMLFSVDSRQPKPVSS